MPLVYPNAAVILNTRPSATDWVRSVSETLDFFFSPTYRFVCLLWKTDRLHYMVQKISRDIMRERFGADAPIPSVMFWERYHEWVRSEAAKRGRKVLEWQGADGYGPICEFLGRERPEDGVEFPKMNDTQTMRFLQRVLLARGLLSWAVLGGLIWAGWRMVGWCVGTLW